MIDEQPVEAGAGKFVGVSLQAQVDRAQPETSGDEANNEQEKNSGSGRGAKPVTYLALAASEEEYGRGKSDIGAEGEIEDTKNELKAGVAAYYPNHLGKPR